MPDSWIDDLVHECEKQWDQNSKVLLLSRVPGVLRSLGHDPNAILRGRKLKETLHTEAVKRLHLIQNNENPILWGAVPASAGIEAPYSRYFPRAEVGTEAGEVVPRYLPAVWRAFGSEIPNGQRRYIFLGSHIFFRDLPEDVDRPEASVELEKNFAASAGPAGHGAGDKDVADRIRSWARANAIDETTLFAQKREQTMRQISAEAKVPGDSALSALINLLKPSERERISMALDIVARLLSTKH